MVPSGSASSTKVCHGLLEVGEFDGLFADMVECELILDELVGGWLGCEKALVIEDGSDDRLVS